MAPIRWSLEHGMSIRRWGAADAKPCIVWIHGLGEHSTSFDPIAQHAALADCEHVLVDLPGYGRSPWPDDDSPCVRGTRDGADRGSLDALADHVVAWLRESGIAKPIVVGHSMGGVLATLIAERIAAGSLAGIVNVEGNISRGDCEFSSQVLPFAVDEFIATGFAEMRDRVYQSGVGWPGSQGPERALRGYHAAMVVASPRQFHRNAADLVALSETEQLAPRFGALAVPRLYVAGAPLGITAHSKKLLDRHVGKQSGARWVAIEPAGHWVYLDQRDRFADELAAFIRTTRG